MRPLLKVESENCTAITYVLCPIADKITFQECSMTFLIASREDGLRRPIPSGDHKEHLSSRLEKALQL